MENKSQKTGAKEGRATRTTGGVGARKSLPFTRKPTATGVKRPYSPRTEGPTRGARKSFDARPDFVRKGPARAPYTNTDAKPHYVRAATTRDGERKTFTPRGAGRPSFTRTTSDAKPRYERKTGTKEEGGRSSYGARTERASFGARKEFGTKPTLEKKPGAYGYKERGASTRPRTKSIPHARTQSWSQSRDASPRNKEITPGTTSWGKVANWYNEHLTSDDTYHKKVLLPNILRLVEPKKDETIVDIACGQGYFTQALHEKGARLIGVDISEELIEIARKRSPDITYHVSSAEDLTLLPDKSADKVIIMLAIQNIEHTQKLCAEVSRILKDGGTFHIVMNHPAFRIPKQSSWDYDDKKKVQYRRIDQYIADSRTAIDMHPGMKDSTQTLSFHRPLQYYFKVFGKAGFAVDRLEEWISHKESDSGPRAQAENRARKEIPLFLYLRAIKQ